MRTERASIVAQGFSFEFQQEPSRARDDAIAFWWSADERAGYTYWSKDLGGLKTRLGARSWEHLRTDMQLLSAYTAAERVAQTFARDWRAYWALGAARFSAMQTELLLERL